MFRLKDVKFKDILDIKDTNIKKNEVTAIIGKSGSGKTTILRLLNKMTSPDSGSIYFKEEDIKNLDSIELRRKVQMLSQFPIIFKGNIRDNLNIGLKFMDENPKSDEELSKVLNKVHLNKSLDENSKNLSGGEKQRLCIGRIVLSNPEVFLFDEPSSSLDEDTEKIIIDSLVNHIRSCDKTLVFVTHSLDMAYEYADTILEIVNKDLKERRNEK
ncbi:ATP-binding cassette domain-containing protein [Lagierella sp.]|uniref:ABC transporter ATP-binding protein n=1 Tax=Lagierella sp. TaxID=2849657 RepID=UPI00261EB55E|nr:ATP-binding cassette domain-containing protein [Lagierella sp.]